MRACAEVSAGEVVAIDGKTSRRSHDRRSRKGALHLVSVWATANWMVLGQRKPQDHSKFTYQDPSSRLFEDHYCDIGNMEAIQQTLYDAMQRGRRIRLIIIDPISAYMGEADSHKNAEVRAKLAALAELAQVARLRSPCLQRLQCGDDLLLRGVVAQGSMVSSTSSVSFMVGFIWTPPVCQDRFRCVGRE